ncbi:AAA family ATPase [Plesiomonas shigelloides]|uniref:AAA family ATPase n=1 Tax=Plesiomonas shigelloides TaxID=703 RepID=UPI001C49B0D6|nr:AAA family ATPase [Plesiomonas shigelloides]
MIRLSELNKDNKGNKGATRVTYVIKFINNELSIVSDNERIFEHILSLGDRSALALAFFLSRFHKPNMEKSVIILDDPMSSLDNHRKNATIIEIEKLVNNNYQTFILSHDPFFLSDIHKHAILSKITSCFEIHASYVDANPLVKNSMQYISGKLMGCANYDSYVMHSYTKEYNTLYDFVQKGGEESKVATARSIRPVLEAYLRFLHPREFTAGVWLGAMLTKIREEKNPDSPLYDKHKKFNAIDKINQFSKQFHHAQEFDTNIQSLDLQTVKSYAKETLLLITGL